MSPLPYEEIAWASTPIGEISLRRRYDRLTERWVHEVRLGDEYLMSSQFNATEIALATLGLAEAPERDLSVVVGGLGLGFTAFEALQDSADPQPPRRRAGRGRRRVAPGGPDPRHGRPRRRPPVRADRGGLLRPGPQR